MTELKPDSKWVITGPLTASLLTDDGAELGGIDMTSDIARCESWNWSADNGEPFKSRILNYVGRNRVADACMAVESRFLRHCKPTARPKLKRSRLYMPNENQE